MTGCNANGGELRPSPRGVALLSTPRRRKELYEQLHPETKQGAVGRAGKKDASSASFSDDPPPRPAAAWRRTPIAGGADFVVTGGPGVRPLGGRRPQQLSVLEGHLLKAILDPNSRERLVQDAMRVAVGDR